MPWQQLLGARQRTLGPNPPFCVKGYCILYKPRVHRCEGKQKEGTEIFLRSVQFHFCQILLVAAFGERPSSQKQDSLPQPATLSFLPLQRWSWTSLLPSCCLLIINEGKDNISLRGLSMLRHSCGWLSAQIQSCRSFWRCQSPQAPTGTQVAHKCYMIARQCTAARQVCARNM